jgi:hypothetical protein
MKTSVSTSAVHFVVKVPLHIILQKAGLSFLFALFCGIGSFAQDAAQGRVPVYPVPYDMPSLENIKEVLNRVKGYYESTSPQTILDSKTEKIITDFTSYNPNATPSTGFSSEWSYTHGVVLSAFDYITKVTGDENRRCTPEGTAVVS